MHTDPIQNNQCKVKKSKELNTFMSLKDNDYIYILYMQKHTRTHTHNKHTHTLTHHKHTHTLTHIHTHTHTHTHTTLGGKNVMPGQTNKETCRS